ncbi:uncharacterized protein LOC134276327 [Saccostrea cucullata]|uniref:uncharacterized protein LOC134276327 n=1 Tax=Saccostrea cuccullata TaxID=36930 RepID=UPI002ED3E9C0
MGDSRLPSRFSPPSEPRIRKKRASSESSGAYESDESYSSRSKHGRYGGDRVLNWSTSQLESFGIYYDVKATELSELYKSTLEKMFSWSVGNTAFLTKLLHIKEVLIESTKNCVQSLDVDEDFEMENLRLPDITEETKKCIQAMAQIKEEMSLKFGSEAASDNLSRDLYSLWFTGISEYVQYYSDLIKELNSEGRGAVEGQFSQLLKFFSKIFLMNPMRGDASQKVKMTLNGIETSSVPDLRCSMQGDLSIGNVGSLVTVSVGEVKTCLPCAYGEKISTDFYITKWKLRNQSVDGLLGQHGGELLLETNKSVLADTNLGIICVKTMIIFTRLDWEKGHLVCLKYGTKVDDKRSYIHYSKPYNFLVRKDREEILDTMFNLGLLCRVRSLLTYQE